VVVAAVGAAETITRFRFLTRLIDNPASISFVQAETVTNRENLVFSAWFAFYILTGIVFLVWMHRVYDNVEPLGAPRPRHSRGWVVGGWLVPFLNFIRPKQIIDDIWWSSGPLGQEPAPGTRQGGTIMSRERQRLMERHNLVERDVEELVAQVEEGEVDSATADRLLTDYRRELETVAAAIAALPAEELAVPAPAAAAEATATHHRPRLTVVWWASWLVGALALFGSDEATDLVSIRGFTAAEAVGRVSLVVAAIAAFWLVALLTRTQEAKAGRVLGGYEPRVPFDVAGTGRFTSLMVVAAMAAAAAGLVSFDVSPNSPVAADPPVTTSAGRGVLLQNLRVGDCWNSNDFATADPTETVEMLFVAVVDCDSPHLGEVYLITDIEAGTGAPYPGELVAEIRALETCLDRFSNTFAESYESSSIGVMPVFPLEGSWALGDREVICSATDPESQMLSGRAEEIQARLPGTDVNVRAAASCDELVEITLQNAQDSIDAWEALTPAQLDALGADDVPLELMRSMKRDQLIFLKFFDLDCSAPDFDAQFIAATGDLHSATPWGESIIETWNQDGYWGEAVMAELQSDS
jgi:hypothetical protein